MFQFSLEPLLNHRKFQEEALQKEMAELQQRLALERSRAADLCRTLVDSQDRLGGMHRHGARACDFQMMVRYLGRLKELVHQQEDTVRRAVHRIERKRAELIDAVKQRKMIETLKEKAERGYHKQTRRKEMSLINEIAIGRYNRARQGSAEDR